MKNSDWTIAAVGGAVVFIVLYLFLDLEFIISLLLGGLVFGAFSFIFQTKTHKEIYQENTLEEALTSGKNKLKTIRQIQENIKNSSISSKVDLICNSIEKILAEVKRDPLDLPEAKQFLSYYLDTTINILEKYVKLSSQNVKDSGIKSSLEKVSGTLDMLVSAFDKQLTKLLSNDKMSLDTDLELLEKTIKMEGLGGDN